MSVVCVQDAVNVPGINYLEKELYLLVVFVVQDVCLTNKTKLHVDASVVSAVCVASQLQPIGSLVLTIPMWFL